MVWQRCEGALIHDARTDRWRALGAPTPLPAVARVPVRPSSTPAPLAPILAVDAAEGYQDRVARAIEYIRAGDVYQVNLAHTIDAALRATPRALSSALIQRSAPWYGAHVEHVDPDGRARAVCSASPELFLDIDPVRSGRAPRRVLARPMKGTLPGHLDPHALERSAKDRAELDMIVDLMRNDLGRVSRNASVRVDQRRAIEPHGGLATPLQGSPRTPAVWQGVATVSAHLRSEVSLLDLLRAVFPPGSVTGAPKIRAMQIIESLEDRPRGPYCGCIGFIGDDGRVSLSVAIRTALTEIPPHTPARPAGAAPAGLVSYSVGAGIVADSDPAREWDETMHKAAALLRLGHAPDSPSIVALTTPLPTPDA